MTFIYIITKGRKCVPQEVHKYWTVYLIMNMMEISFEVWVITVKEQC
jgi:hypothetical protein